MVRRRLAGAGSLRYGAGMTDEEEPGLRPARAWTPQAAMEPVPPLAPPPARPGAGVAVGGSRRAQRRGPSPVATAVTVTLLVIAVAGIALFVLFVVR